MIKLTDAELARLDPVVEARTAGPGVANNKGQGENVILTDKINSSILPLGDLSIRAQAGEGLSVSALMQIREAALK
jgi:hypothetical protein